MIDLTIDGGLAVVTLHNPETRNSLAAPDLEELAEVLSRAERAARPGPNRVRALVVRGSGGAFCSGRNIAGVDPETDDVPRFLDGLVAPVMRQISEFPAPSYAAVTGPCLGVGLGLAIACDVVYVEESAKIGSPFARLGATLDSGGHALFVERLGTHRALDLIYSGRLLSGTEAVAAGLFSRVFPDGLVEDETLEAARTASTGATDAFLASKEIVQRIRDERLGLWATMELETRAQTALRETSDYREGFAAFQEKRRPVFRR